MAICFCFRCYHGNKITLHVKHASRNIGPGELPEGTIKPLKSGEPRFDDNV